MTSAFEQMVHTNFRNIFDRLTNLEAHEPPIVAAMYTQTSGTTTIGTSDTVINFDTKVLDTRNAVTVGAGWVFTVPIAGYYQVTSCVRFAANSDFDKDNSAVLKLYVNGGYGKNLDFFEGFDQDTSYTVSLSGTGMLHCAVGDTLDIRASQDAAVGGIASVATAALTWVDIFKLVS
jgi:hypothetical protein